MRIFIHSKGKPDVMPAGLGFTSGLNASLSRSPLRGVRSSGWSGSRSQVLDLRHPSPRASASEQNHRSPWPSEITVLIFLPRRVVYPVTVLGDVAFDVAATGFGGADKRLNRTWCAFALPSAPIPRRLEGPGPDAYASCFRGGLVRSIAFPFRTSQPATDWPSAR